MKPYLSVRSGFTMAACCGLAVAFLCVATRARADVQNKKTVLTVDQPIQVQDTYLDPGTYVFKLMNSDSDRHIVQIFNKDEDHIYNTILAIPNYRMQPTDNSQFTFYETPPGTARALHAWFYPGDNYGQEFRYPKHPREIAMVTTSTAPPPLITRPAEPEPPPPSAVVTPAEPEPAPAPPPQAQAEPQKQEEPVVMAQNTPPPAPSAEAPKPEEPKELPKSASPFPLIGLSGLISLAGYAALRIRNLS